MKTYQKALLCIVISLIAIGACWPNKVYDTSDYSTMPGAAVGAATPSAPMETVISCNEVGSCVYSDAEGNWTKCSADRSICVSTDPETEARLNEPEEPESTVIVVTANGSAVVTYSDGTSVSQKKFSGRWTKRYDYNPDDVMVGVNGVGATKVQCKIVENGDEADRNKASGLSATAICSG